MNTILFDLDGTLLPMDVDVFTKGYFGALAKRCIPLGFDGDALVGAVWRGTKAMVANDGALSNEERFWQVFSSVLGEKVLTMKEEFEDFYHREFRELSSFTQPNPFAKPCVDVLRDKGYTVALATNPLFPFSGMEARLAWLGLAPRDFDLITSYENTAWAKPNLGYYHHILQTLDKAPGDCLMVGNDPVEDMCAAEVGIDVYLVTDCMVNGEGVDTSGWKQGSFADFYAYATALPPATK